MRQIRGSSNLKGSEALHILSGHLSHQIEHHLYPDVPGHAAIAKWLQKLKLCVKNMV